MLLGPPRCACSRPVLRPLACARAAATRRGRRSGRREHGDERGRSARTERVGLGAAGPVETGDGSPAASCGGEETATGRSTD